MRTRRMEQVQVTDLVASERAISFGPFRLVPTQRLLLEDDNPVRVGSRALDILTTLVERPGELVGKHELIARVWRGTFVEEGNLKFQVGALRRALGDGRGGRRYIATSAGQGYRFVVFNCSDIFNRYRSRSTQTTVHPLAATATAFRP
jgi:DNA-binding winged helix-turn-helix (wHTH) protein